MIPPGSFAPWTMASKNNCPRGKFPTGYLPLPLDNCPENNCLPDNCPSTQLSTGHFPPTNITPQARKFPPKIIALYQENSPE